MVQFPAIEDWINDMIFREILAFHGYLGTAHWFIESGWDAYQPESAALAWKRTVEFLDTLS
jgi:dienelactone hydrolase